MKVHLAFLNVIGTILIFCYLTNIVFAQPDTLWTKTYGGINGDIGYSVQQTSDGGYIIVGTTELYEIDDVQNNDLYLIKTDNEGDTLWTKKYGEEFYDVGRCIQQTNDNGYIIVGSKETGPSWLDGDYWVIKTDEIGDTVWTKTYGTDQMDYGRFIQKTYDNGYIITGGTQSDFDTTRYIGLIKINSNGDTLWTRSFGDFTGISVEQTQDSGYVLLGIYWDDTNDEEIGKLIKTNIDGDTIWTSILKRAGEEYRGNVIQTRDGNYVVSGFTYNGTGEDMGLVKLDSEGKIIWSKEFGGISDEDGGGFVQQTEDGGFISVGYKYSNLTGYDLFIVKTDINGEKLWENTIGGEGEDDGCCIGLTSDGGYIITGTTYKYGSSDIWLVRIASDTITTKIENNFNNTPTSFVLHPNYPNPFNPNTTIRYDIPEDSFVKITIYDLLGRKVTTLINKTQNAGYKSITWDGKDVTGHQVSSGMYLYIIRTGRYSSTRKMLLLK